MRVLFGALPLRPLAALVVPGPRSGGQRGHRLRAVPSDLAEVGPIVDMFRTTRTGLAFDDVLAVARDRRPDLIVADTIDLVAPLVAAAIDVPRVSFSVATALPPALEKGFRGAGAASHRPGGVGRRADSRRRSPAARGGPSSCSTSAPWSPTTRC